MEATRPSTIAVVDDDSAVRKALERLLRGAGFGVVTFPWEETNTYVDFSYSYYGPRLYALVTF